MVLRHPRAFTTARPIFRTCLSSIKFLPGIRLPISWPSAAHWIWLSPTSTDKYLNHVRLHPLYRLHHQLLQHNVLSFLVGCPPNVVIRCSDTGFLCRAWSIPCIRGTKNLCA